MWALLQSPLQLHICNVHHEGSLDTDHTFALANRTQNPAEYVKRFAKKTDAEEPSAKDASEGTGSDGFLSSSDDEDDLPASGGGGGMT